MSPNTFSTITPEKCLGSPRYTHFMYYLRTKLVDIMRTIQGYLGEEYDGKRKAVSGGDQLTCERQMGVQRLTS